MAAIFDTEELEYIEAVLLHIDAQSPGIIKSDTFYSCHKKTSEALRGSLDVNPLECRHIWFRALECTQQWTCKRCGSACDKAP